MGELGVGLGLDEVERVRLEAIDEQNIVHSWAVQAEYRSELMVRAEGPFYWDGYGRRFLDFASQAYFANVGAGCERIADAIAEQARRLPYAHMAGTRPKLELAEKLLALLPDSYSRVWFGCNGSDAIELALKVARLVTGRQGIIAFHGEYHGASMGATSVTGLPMLRHDIGALVPGTIFVPGPADFHSPLGGSTQQERDRNTLSFLQNTIERVGPETIAGILAEPIPTNPLAGAAIPGRQYWRDVRALCDEYKLVLISDEIVTGFGRIGYWFGRDYYDYEPDIICLGKGLTSGYLPLSAAVCRQDLVERFSKTYLPHGLTHAGHPVSCAAALANIQVIEDDNLVANAAHLGARLTQRLASLSDQHPSVRNVGSIGLWAGIELDPQLHSDRPPTTATGATAAEAGAGVHAESWLYQQGVLVRALGNVIKLAPPINITHDHIDHTINLIDEYLTKPQG